ncbi:MAG: cyclic nucleotide-binding domain-containing protein [Elusimicrobia bacterium]|nr:cyclic nucleotide-binding domain-containing protein [Elusimicrobiota bacterium]MBD3411630.1 cyclic nucleotide-binding domain-containing protein [Elusimicrobiota bacterium]
MSQWEDITADKKQTLVKALKNVDLLNCFSDDQLSTLLNDSKIRDFEQGEIILLKGEISESLYVIGSGHAVVCLKKNPVTLGGCSYFGEISLFRIKPVTCTVKSSDKGVRVLALPGKKLKEMVEATPQAKTIIEAIINRRSAPPPEQKKSGPMKPPDKK